MLATEKVKKPGSKNWEQYSINGDSIDRKKKSCPKCGSGVFMAQHKNRVVCGKCAYVEILAKKEE